MRIARFNKNLFAAIFTIFIIIVIGNILIVAQSPISKTKDFKTTWKTFQIARNYSGTPAEKSINVDEKVNLQFCVSEGNVKVTGWDRSEVRVFVSEGSQIGFKVMQKNSQTDKPVWIAVVGNEPESKENFRFDECLSGEEIELEVPRNATVNIKSRESKTKIDSVRKVNVKNSSGGIFLNNIAEGVEASTYEGDVTVEKSNGAMNLESVSGNVLAFDVHSSEIGDRFKAKTSSGIITLKDIGHRQLEIETNSGSIRFNGAFVVGGQYAFGTTNGAINLNIPVESSCNITASYGFGVFNTDLPMKNIEKSQSRTVKNLTATMGKGDCTLNLRTYNGAIMLADSSVKETDK